MENLCTVATQVGILFTLIGVGFICRKSKLLNDTSVSGLVNILLIIVTPCLVVDVFQRPFDPAKMKALSTAFAISIVIHLAIIAISVICFKRGNYKTQSVFRCAAVFSNAGFMGIPLEQAIFGDEGVFFGIIYVVVFNLMFWSWGLKTMGGGTGLKKTLINPGTIGLLAGFPLFFLSIELPKIIQSPVHMLAQLNTPIPMINRLLPGRFKNLAYYPQSRSVAIRIFATCHLSNSLNCSILPDSTLYGSHNDARSRNGSLCACCGYGLDVRRQIWTRHRSVFWPRKRYNVIEHCNNAAHHCSCNDYFIIQWGDCPPRGWKGGGTVPLGMGDWEKKEILCPLRISKPPNLPATKVMYLSK
jgi:hypothetical protein